MKYINRRQIVIYIEEIHLSYVCNHFITENPFTALHGHYSILYPIRALYLTQFYHLYGHIWRIIFSCFFFTASFYHYYVMAAGVVSCIKYGMKGYHKLLLVILSSHFLVKSCNKYGISYVTFPAELKGFYASFAFI